MIKNFNLHLLTLFGVGYIKFAPGTFASFITCLIYFLLIKNNIEIEYICLFLITIFVYLIPLINKYIKNLKVKDRKEIVIDEFLGQSIPIIFILFFYDTALDNNLYSLENDLFIFMLLCISFILFRFFDIIKPFPINFIDENFKNSLGILLDDIIAGIYSIIIIIFLYIFLF